MTQQLPKLWEEVEHLSSSDAARFHKMGALHIALPRRVATAVDAMAMEMHWLLHSAVFGLIVPNKYNHH